MTQSTFGFKPFSLLRRRTGSGGGRIEATANRRLQIEGSHNLRDLGGIESSLGGQIRPGLVFRSGSLERLTPSGVNALVALGIGTIFDFRSAAERDHSPTHWLADHCIETWQLGLRESLGDPRPLLAQSYESPGRTRAMMRNVYRMLPLHHRHSYAALFQALARDDRPILFHCAAGKDRTGVAAALLLAVLGVDRAHINADYLETNAVIDSTTQMFLSDPRNAAALAARAATWKPMMTADVGYLDAMFDVIATTHGSVESYVQTKLEFSAAEIAHLRQRLLE